jgi:hypothetical protein
LKNIFAARQSVVSGEAVDVADLDPLALPINEPGEQSGDDHGDNPFHARNQTKLGANGEGFPKTERDGLVERVARSVLVATWSELKKPVLLKWRFRGELLGLGSNNETRALRPDLKSSPARTPLGAVERALGGWAASFFIVVRYDDVVRSTP